MKKISLFIIMLISVQQSFALFPTDEMLKDPLFDSLFVIHNEKERRVDDSLYRVYGSNEGYIVLLFNLLEGNNDPRIPKNIRKVIVIKNNSPKTKEKNLITSRVNTPYIFTLPKGKYFYARQVGIVRFINESSNPLQKYLEEKIGNYDSSFYNKQHIKASKLWDTTPEYMKRVNIGEPYSFLVINPQVSLPLFKATAYCISLLNKKEKSNGIEFFAIKYDEANNRVYLGSTYNGIKNYVMYKCILSFDDEMKFKSITVKGAIDYDGVDINKLTFLTNKNKLIPKIKKGFERYLNKKTNLKMFINDIRPSIASGRRIGLGKNDKSFGKFSAVSAEVFLYNENNFKKESYEVEFDIFDDTLHTGYPSYILTKKYSDNVFPLYYYFFAGQLGR